MSNKTCLSRGALWTALASSVAMAAAPVLANAQGYDQQGYSDPAPPQGQYADPPPGMENGEYDLRYSQYDTRYGEEVSRWSAENCIQNRQNNAVAGAVIGGVLGAVVGSNVSGRHNRTEGAVAGGVLGATAGAAIGSSGSSSVGCPPGYAVRPGASAFVYGGPVYGPSVYAYPTWYNPWVFSGGRYVYRPYRSWYAQNRRYWRHTRVCHVNRRGVRVCR